MRNRIIAKTLKKLAEVDRVELSKIINRIDKIYLTNRKTPYESTSFPKEIEEYMGEVARDSKYEQKDKLALFNELKSKGMFNWTLNRGLERTWRAIFKEWGLPHLNFS